MGCLGRLSRSDGWRANKADAILVKGFTTAGLHDCRASRLQGCFDTIEDRTQKLAIIGGAARGIGVDGIARDHASHGEHHRSVVFVSWDRGAERISA